MRDENFADGAAVVNVAKKLVALRAFTKAKGDPEKAAEPKKDK